MNWFRRFWSQPSRRYRNFHIVYTVLTLNFAIPAISYAVAPQVIVQQLMDINAQLGGSAYPADAELHSMLWRYLGAANVMTLALMCGLLQLNLRRFRVVLLPLVFLKAYNATLFLFGFLGNLELPGLLAVAVLDYVTSFVMVFFARRGFSDIEERQDAELVPRPWDVGPRLR